MRPSLLDAQVSDTELRARKRRLRGADLAAGGQEDRETEGKRDGEKRSGCVTQARPLPLSLHHSILSVPQCLRGYLTRG